MSCRGQTRTSRTQQHWWGWAGVSGDPAGSLGWAVSSAHLSAEADPAPGVQTCNGPPAVVPDVSCLQFHRGKWENDPVRELQQTGGNAGRRRDGTGRTPPCSRRDTDSRASPAAISRRRPQRPSRRRRAGVSRLPQSLHRFTLTMRLLGYLVAVHERRSDVCSTLRRRAGHRRTATTCRGSSIKPALTRSASTVCSYFWIPPSCQVCEQNL